jgi:hypothetical protein
MLYLSVSDPIRSLDNFSSMVGFPLLNPISELNVSVRPLFKIGHI